jgi:shikimate kinase
MWRRLRVNLYLVGYRCTGKTSVGRLLSDTLGWIFVDMDHELARDAGTSIEDVVHSRGWMYFREQEGRLLQRLSESTKQVISTGGGIVTIPENISTMRGSGRVVWLQASPVTIAQRMAADRNTVGQRPPLLGHDSSAEIQEVLAERQPLYEQANHFHVETDGLSLPEVAERILAWLKSLDVAT